MSLPPNMQPLNSDDGKSRQLLFYEAKILETMKGPIASLGETLDSMVRFMHLKATTQEDKLLIETLVKKAAAELCQATGNLCNIIDSSITPETVTKLVKESSPYFRKDRNNVL